MAKHSITQLHNRRRDETHYMTTQKHVGVPSGQNESWRLPLSLLELIRKVALVSSVDITHRGRRFGRDRSATAGSALRKLCLGKGWTLVAIPLDSGGGILVIPWTLVAILIS